MRLLFFTLRRLKIVIALPLPIYIYTYLYLSISAVELQYIVLFIKYRIRKLVLYIQLEDFSSEAVIDVMRNKENEAKATNATLQQG